MGTLKKKRPSMRDFNRQIKNLNCKRKQQITIRLPFELRKEIQMEADRRGFTSKDVILIILHQHFQKSIAQE